MRTTVTAQQWLADAVLYQIYPQSFADSNADGIGDIRGITERLDYLSWLGVNAMWLNPVFASPFADAGYDVSDYLRIAERYGTQQDLAQLVEAAHHRGIRVLLDLVIGHTAVEHPWFRHAADHPGDNRYIWAPAPAPGFVASPGTRIGFYRKNFLPSQPALNFGYARSAPGEPWRQPPDADGPRANRSAIREVIGYWLDRDVDGFRCDMAYSLVKDDPDLAETAKVWTEVRRWLDARHPHAALLSEWDQPAVAVPAGFHADFFLHFRDDAWRSLFDNGEGIRWASANPIQAYFTATGSGSAAPFVQTWRAAQDHIADLGYAIMPTSNHDYSRLSTGSRTGAQLTTAFAMLMTWPTVPAIYYGDEIGMRFLTELAAREGSELAVGNNRAGSRTPMQWDGTANAGFSTADPAQLYLPIDPDLERPTVAGQQHAENSLLNTVRSLIRLRREYPGLGTRGSVTVLNDGYPLAYLRDDRYLVVINPSSQSTHLPAPPGRVFRTLMTDRVEAISSRITADAYSFGIFDTSTG